MSSAVTEAILLIQWIGIQGYQARRCDCPKVTLAPSHGLQSLASYSGEL